MDTLRVLDLRALSWNQIGESIVKACRQARVVVTRTDSELGCEREFWDSALADHGERAAVDEDAGTGRPTGELWSDVSFDPARQNTFRHSNSAQPLHTDGSYVANPPALVFMVCRKAASGGGATLFLDGAQLAGTLSREQPDLFRRLTTEPVIFSKGGSDIESTILSLPHGDGPRLRWNYYALSGKSEPGARALAEDFRHFLQQHPRSGLLSIRLQPGEAVFFHDSRVLHGRESFDARSPGDRWLWKAGLRI